MDDPKARRLAELLLRAFELPPEQRDAYLVRECGEDASLLDEARGRLKATDERATMRTSALRPADLEQEPERIGPYRILGTIGEGGMGIVYLAEQEEPVRRRVALKIIKLGMNTPEVISRFEAERQALALMTHPNIARVFDAGATEYGRPYFVMEHVPGIPITEHCDRHRLSNPDRLDLFQRVCGAIHHAHQKGVIHRDIKPSNILVSFEGDQAVPKVIDFGVAKATSQRLTESTIYTEQGLIIGTPEYMSPEQAEMTGQGVDTTTDVYSLGVVLYELLTGALPFTSKELRAAGYQAMQQVIREQDPPHPSTRISKLGDTANYLAAVRRTDVWSWRRLLKRELDWIVMRALEKDRSHRYPSVSELAADVGRFLHNEPVLARPHSAAYQLRKLVARHTAPFVFAGVLFVVLLGFGFWMSVLYRQAESAREQEAIEAETASQVSSFLVEMFEKSDPGQARGDSVTVREVLDRGAEQIETKLGDQPEIKARLLHTFGRVYTGLGLYEVAEPLHQEGLDLREGVLGSDALETGRSLHNLARTYAKQGRYDEALLLLERAAAIKEAHLGPRHHDVAASLSALAAAYEDTQQFAQAESLSLQAIETFAGSEAAGSENHSIAIMNLGNLYRNLARYDEAGSLYVEALEIQEQALGEDHPLVARTLNNMGEFYWRTGRFPDSEAAYLRSLAIREKILDPKHEDTARTLGSMALLYSDMGRLDEAEELELRALALVEEILGPDHIIVAWGYNDLGRIYYMQGRLAEALEAVQRSTALKERLLGSDNPDFAMSLGNVAAVMQEQGRNLEAKPLLERALRIEEEKLGREHPNTIEMVLTLANLHRDLTEHDVAEGFYERALADYEKSVGPAHPAVAAVLESQAVLRARRGDVAGIDSAFERALAIRTEAQGEGSPPVADCLYKWGCAMAESGEATRALDRLNQAVAAGFDNDVIFEEKVLESLHGNPEFDVLVQTIRERNASTGD